MFDLIDDLVDDFIGIRPIDSVIDITGNIVNDVIDNPISTVINIGTGAIVENITESVVIGAISAVGLDVTKKKNIERMFDC